MNTVVVIGGGASGIIAALEAAKDKSNKVTLLEKQARIGKKLSATGNGRCNLTNTNANIDHYHGANPVFVEEALSTLSPMDTISYFKDLGLLTVEQYGGRVYPLSDSANSVIDVLRFALASSSVDVVTSCSVNSVHYSNNTFTIKTDDQTYSSQKLIVACGGKAGGKLGGCSDGYDILASLGHHCTKIHPALVPVTICEDIVKSLKGIRCEAELKLNNITSRGELQFTENGISGPAAFDISREAALNGGEVHINFLAGDVKPILESRLSAMPHLEIGSLLNGMLHSRLGLAIVKHCGYKPSNEISTLTNKDLEIISNTCSDFKLKIKGIGNFDVAQITVGGINTNEFSSSTMESKIVPNLYACGEVLDIDGDCGGYNLQWAWSSGYVAGRLGR